MEEGIVEDVRFRYSSTENARSGVVGDPKRSLPRGVVELESSTRSGVARWAFFTSFSVPSKGNVELTRVTVREKPKTTAEVPKESL